MEYASRAVGNAGLTTGIIGTALGALNGVGGVGGILGGNKNSDDQPVTRFEANMMREISDRDQKIASLEANKYTDQKITDLSDKVNTRFSNMEQQLGQQAVYNATNNGIVACLQSQVAQLQSMTKIVVPNSSVMPGWGNVAVTPVPPIPPVPPTPPATSTTTTGNG